MSACKLCNAGCTLTHMQVCVEEDWNEFFLRSRDPQLENCGGSKLRRLDRFYEFCSKKNGKKLFLNSSRCFVTRYSYLLTNLKLR